MSDLISRQVTIDTVEKWFFNLDDNRMPKEVLLEMPSAQRTTCKYWDTESDFCALYRPSAQPEIITCKDCKHGMYDVMCKFYWCHGVAHSANWFCADAERRTDGSD